MTTSSYDAGGRLIKTTDPLGHSAASIYDAAGELTAKTDANGHTTDYSYDAAGDKTTLRVPENQSALDHTAALYS